MTMKAATAIRMTLITTPASSSPKPIRNPAPPRLPGAIVHPQDGRAHDISKPRVIGTERLLELALLVLRQRHGALPRNSGGDTRADVRLTTRLYPRSERKRACGKSTPQPGPRAARRTGRGATPGTPCISPRALHITELDLCLYRAHGVGLRRS